MKKLTGITLTLLLCTFVHGQNLVWEKTIDYESVTFQEYFYKKNPPVFCGDTLFIFDGLLVDVFVPGQKKPKRYDLNSYLTKKQSQLINSKLSFSHCLSGNNLVIKNGSSVFLFQVEHLKFKLKQQIQLRSKYGSTIFFTNNTLYFYEIYNSYRQPERITSGFLEYNLTTGEERIHPLPFNCLSVTHINPNRFVDFTSKGYILCDPFSYKLYEYDFNHMLKDSISAPDKFFTVSSASRFNEAFPFEKTAANPSSFFEKMNAYLDSTDRIWLINYVDDHTIFIRLTRNSIKTKDQKNQLFYDHVWERKKDGWQLVQVKEISNFNTEQTITEKDLWPHFFPGSKYSCSKGILYYTFWSSSSNIFPQVGTHFFGFDTQDRNKLSLKLIEFKLK